MEVNGRYAESEVCVDRRYFTMLDSIFILVVISNPALSTDRRRPQIFAQTTGLFISENANTYIAKRS